MRLIDADALVNDLEHDIAIDEDILAYVGTDQTTRSTIQFDKDCKQNAIDLVMGTPTIDAVSEWIPCEERLPSENGRYLVVYPMLINKPWVSILWYGKPTFSEKDEPCFYASDDEYGDAEYSDVIAWMPLPKPYGEREGE